MSSPTPERQLILQRILLALMIHLRANPGQGLALTDVEFALDENYRVRPDVLVLLHDRAQNLDMNKIPCLAPPIWRSRSFLLASAAPILRKSFRRICVMGCGKSGRFTRNPARSWSIGAARARLWRMASFRLPFWKDFPLEIRALF